VLATVSCENLPVFGVTSPIGGGELREVEGAVFLRIGGIIQSP